MDAASRTLGQTAGGTLRRIHTPLMRSSLLAAGILESALANSSVAIALGATARQSSVRVDNRARKILMSLTYQ